MASCGSENRETLERCRHGGKTTDLCSLFLTIRREIFVGGNAEKNKIFEDGENFLLILSLVSMP